MIIKHKYSLGLVAGAFLLGSAQNSSAAQTWLAFRSGCAMPLHSGVTVQTLDTKFGTNLIALPFSDTSTYDFFSAPLNSAVSLTATDQVGGVIYLRNSGRTGVVNFSVTGRMSYFDYNPNTGINVPLADTGASDTIKTHHGQVASWAVPTVTFPANATVPAGHMIHVAMTIELVSSKTAIAGEVLYNGASGQSTAALFSLNQAPQPNFSFDSSAILGAAAKIVSVVQQPDGSMLISCAGQAATAYSIQATASLQSPVWTTLGTTTSDANGLFSFVDTNATNYSCRFYRTAM